MADPLQGAVAEPGSTPAAATAPAASPVGSASSDGSSRGRRRRTLHGGTSIWVALLWLGPALLLIFGVVVFPAVQLVRAAFSKYSITGLRLGDAGTTNFENVLNHSSLTTVLANTVVRELWFRTFSKFVVPASPSRRPVIEYLLNAALTSCTAGKTTTPKMSSSAGPSHSSATQIEVPP